MKPLEIYSERVKNYSEIKSRLDAKSNLLSNIRLLVFLGGAVLAVLTFMYIGTFPGFAVTFVSLALFIFLVVRHEAVVNSAKRYGNLIKINKMCCSRIEGDWIDFTDNGQEYDDKKHPYSADLDVFGHTSLYQWVNCANTWHGRENLRKLLENPDKQPEQIRKRQKAISELAGKLDFCQELQCAGTGVTELSKDPEELLAYFEDKDKLLSKNWVSYIFYILPMLTLFSIVICLIDKSVSPFIPFVLLVIQSIINVIGYKTGLTLRSINKYKNKIQVFQNLLSIIENEKFQDEYLSQIKASFLYKNKTALKQIKTLENIVNAVDASNNFLFYFILNIFLFWNFHCVLALESWKEHSGTLLRGWLDSMGTMEALSSLAVISQINPEWTSPNIVENKVTVTAIEMGHPLIVEQCQQSPTSSGGGFPIEKAVSGETQSPTQDAWASRWPRHRPADVVQTPRASGARRYSLRELVPDSFRYKRLTKFEKKRVCNNFDMENRICIITGSNMSGKSTLLRTIGINLVLAYAGASVCAKKFECSVMDIYTSMRLGDDLNSGVSTFYAELLRIKTIISNAKAGKPMIFLIDEVFRGTNSRDRYTGAKNVLLNLNKNWIIGLISTHDFDLCDLEKNESGRMVNYHFTEEYLHNEIKFDYKVRPGRCNTTNAKYLMKMVGIEFLEN